MCGRFVRCSPSWHADDIARAQETSFDLMSTGERIVRLPTTMLGNHNIEKMVCEAISDPTAALRRLNDILPVHDVILLLTSGELGGADQNHPRGWPNASIRAGGVLQHSNSIAAITSALQALWSAP